MDKRYPETAIYCDCRYNDHPKVIGSVNAQGYLVIVRAHHFRTIIKAAEFLVSCEQCGFSNYINLKAMALERAGYDETDQPQSTIS